MMRGAAFSLVSLSVAAVLQIAAGVLPVSAQESPAATQNFGAFEFSIDNLEAPTGVDVGADGSIFVVESAAHRLRVLSADGKESRSWGSLGGGSGEFHTPHGVALGPNGRVFVTDSGNHRVQVFDKSGGFVRTWGRRGSKPGEFNDPTGLEVDAERVYVADTGNHRVQVFDHGGKFLFEFGGSAHEPGLLSEPVDVTADSAGNIYVVDQLNNRILKFDAQGRFAKAWGDWGAFAGLFASPSSLLHRDGSIFVADTVNHRVQVFNTGGQVQYQWGIHAFKPREGDGKMHYPNHVALSPAGDWAVVCEAFENRCQVFRRLKSGEEPLSYGAAVTQAQAHYGMRCDSAGALMVIPEPDSHTVLVFNISRQVPINITIIGRHGRKFGEFVDPSDAVVDAERNLVYVCDRGNRRIQTFKLERDGKVIKYDPTMSRFVSSVDLRSLSGKVPGLAAGETVVPDAMARGPRGRFFVLDSRHSKVLVFSEKFEFESAWGEYGVGAGQFRGPTDLAFNEAGDVLFVVDSGNHRVQALTPAGKPLFSLGKAGDGPGQFVRPFGITVGADGELFVTDSDAHRIVKFDGKGKFVSAWGKQGLGPMEFYRPRGILRDARSRLIVIDHGNHRGEILSTAGECLDVFGPWLFTRPAKMELRRRKKKGS